MGWRDDSVDDIDIRLPRSRNQPPPGGPFSQSGLGVASLVISIIVGITMFATIVGATIMVADQVNQPMNDDDPRAIVLGLLILGGIGVALVGLVLGILGAMQPNTSPICAIIGIVFNGLILLAVGGMMCFGMAVGG